MQILGVKQSSTEEKWARKRWVPISYTASPALRCQWQWSTSPQNANYSLMNRTSTVITKNLLKESINLVLRRVLELKDAIEFRSNQIKILMKVIQVKIIFTQITKIFKFTLIEERRFKITIFSEGKEQAWTCKKTSSPERLLTLSLTVCRII
jgi:hypothetical protein